MDTDKDEIFTAVKPQTENVSIDSLLSWYKTDHTVANEGTEPFRKKSPFPLSHTINKKVYLYKGDICKIVVDALVNPSNDNLNETEGVSGRIAKAAGPELKADMERLNGCSAGEVKVTVAYNLLARNIFHTVGPRYHKRFKMASDHALHLCYRTCLQTCLEHKLRTIVFPIITLTRKGHPLEEGAHLALRTVRRFLDNYGEHIDAVVFCLEKSEEYTMYENLMPLYFPRSISEEQKVMPVLPKDLGDPKTGEPTEEERRIRITAFPGQAESDSDDEAPFVPQTPTVSVVKSGLTEMRDDPDKKKLPTEEHDPEDVQVFEKYASQTVDLQRMKSLNAIYQPGLDPQGRPVIVVIGKNIPEEESALELLLSYIIKFMEPLVNKPYSLIYFHSGMSSKSTPGIMWLKTLHTIFDVKYSKTITNFYVVHPTFWLKAFFAVMSPFLSKNVKDKIVYFDGLKDLFKVFTREKLPLLGEIYKFDQQETGQKWEFTEEYQPNDSLHDKL